MYKDANYYYKEQTKGSQEKEKTLILTMALFLVLLAQPNYSGSNWRQYIDVTV